MSIENDLTRIADSLEQLVVVLGSGSVKPPFDTEAEERLEVADKVRKEALAEEIPQPSAEQSAEKKKERPTKAKYEEPHEKPAWVEAAEAVVPQEAPKKEKPKAAANSDEIGIGSYVRVQSDDDKAGLEGTITGGQKAWLTLTIEVGNAAFKAGTSCPVRRSTLVLAKHAEQVEETPVVVVEEAADDFVPSQNLEAPENFILPGSGKHSGKTLNTIFNEGAKGVNYLTWLAVNGLMGEEVTEKVQKFLNVREVDWKQGR